MVGDEVIPVGQFLFKSPSIAIDVLEYGAIEQAPAQQISEINTVVTRVDGHEDIGQNASATVDCAVQNLSAVFQAIGQV